MTKGLVGKVSLFSLIILAAALVLIFVLPTFSAPNYVDDQLLNFTNGTAYSTSNAYSFNSTWTNTSGANNVTFSDLTNFTLGRPDGTITIYNSSGTTPLLLNNTTTLPVILNITFTQAQLGPAGTYNFSFGLNVTNSSGTWTNVTPTVVFTITNASNPINLYLNGSANQNATYTYPQAINATATSAAGTVYLYKNGANVANGTSPQNEQILLGNGTYAYTVNATGNANYSGNTTGLIFYAIVNKGTVTLNLTLNDSDAGNATYTYPQAVNATVTKTSTVNNEGNLSLWRGGVIVASTTSGNNVSEIILLGNGTYNYSATFTASNYTATNVTDNRFVIVDKGVLSASISGSNTTYPSSVSVAPSVSNGGDSDVNYTLWRNTTLVNFSVGSAPTADTSTLGVGAYVYVLNTTAVTFVNWTSNSSIATKTMNVTKGTLNLSLSVPAVTYPSNTAATVTASNSGASDVNYTLYRNNSLVNFSTTNGTAPAGETILLGSGTYNYTIKTVAGPFSNWTENTTGITANVTVSKGTLNLSLSVPAVTYPSNTAATVSETNIGDADINYTLYFLNTSLVGMVNNSSALGNGNMSYVKLLGAGNYVFTLNTSNTSGLENWTANASGINASVTVAPNTSTASYMNLTINGTESNETYIYPNASNVTGWYSTSVFGSQSITFTLYKNNTNVTSTNPVNDTSAYGTGLYIYTYNTSGNTNYSSASKQFNLTISKGTPTLTLLLGGAPKDQSLTSGATSTATAYESNDGDYLVNYTLYRNGAPVSGTTDSGVLPEGAYVYVYNSTGGDNWSSGSVSKTLTVTGAGFVASTGSSGGGTTPATVKVSEMKGNANVTVPTIAAGNTVNVTIAKVEDVDFRQVNISVSNSVNNIKIVITKLLGEPAAVTHTIEGTVYHYIQISNTNFTDSDLKKVYIKFAVNKTWLTNNGVDKANVSLYRWVSDKWNELTTTLIGNDSYEMFYQAESPGFSYFLIGTKGGETTVTPPAPTCTESWTCTEWSVCVNGKQTKTCTDANACGTAVNKPAESQDCVVQGEVQVPTDNSWMYYSFAAIIIIAIAAVLLTFKDKVVTVFSKDKHYNK